MKALVWDGSGLCLYAKRINDQKFVWLRASDGAVRLSGAQMAMLVEGLDWRHAIVHDEVVTLTPARAIKPPKTPVPAGFRPAPAKRTGMRLDLDRLPTDPVLLQKILREMADVMAQERAELEAAKATVQAQTLHIEKLEHRVVRLLRVQFRRSSEKTDIAQLRLMFDGVEVPEAANDGNLAAATPKWARKPGACVPIPAHVPRQMMEHQPGSCPKVAAGPRP